MTYILSTKSLVIATCAAAVGAALLLVTVVLPAQWGIDPVGTGRLLGVTGISVAQSGALALSDVPLGNDSRQFQLAPFESVEIKYRLAADQSMVFSWYATAEVLYDFHSEPLGAAPGTAEGFDRARSRAASGLYTAPFPGVHGWFFENRGKSGVTIRLDTAGFYTEALEYRDGRVISHAVASPVEDAN
ncbi:MAG: hypothetical protein HC809_02930 [Gammaproteobacteria bacterium]|nr:hypothetical protein [Gammaproteobacteria bacterium]